MGSNCQGNIGDFLPCANHFPENPPELSERVAADAPLFAGPDDLTIGRLAFPNGWIIDVHYVREGVVYFQRWAPGVEIQSFFDELYRQPVAVFSSLAIAAGGRWEFRP